MNERVLIVGNHPWAGHSGEIVEHGKTFLGKPLIHVQLDNGMKAGILDLKNLEFLDQKLRRKARRP